MSPMTSVSEAYLALAVMTLVGIGFPVGSFVASRLLRPVVDPNNPTKTDKNQARRGGLEKYPKSKFCDHNQYCASSPYKEKLVK